jgi:hypothetical protein
MTDTNTERRKEWVRAGAPGITLRFSPLLHRDERGRNTFSYTPAHSTDISKTFSRVRRQLGVK